MSGQSEVKTAAALSLTVRKLKHRHAQLVAGTPSMEEIDRFAGLVSAHLSPALGERLTFSMESEQGTVLDSVADKLNRVSTGLEGFFDMFRIKKPTAPDKLKSYEQEIKSRKQQYIEFTNFFMNPQKVKAATMHVKPTVLSGFHGGALTVNGKELDAAGVIKALTKEVADITAFAKAASPGLDKYLNWMESMTALVWAEVNADKTANEYPGLLAALKKQFAKRPPAPSSLYDPAHILSVGIDRSKMPKPTGDGFSSPLVTPKAVVEFAPLTNDQALDLGFLVYRLVTIETVMEQYASLWCDGKHEDIVGFDDPPYRAKAISDVMDAFGWDDAVWDTHHAIDELEIFYIIGSSAKYKSEAIQLWLKNAVVGSP